MGFYDLGDLSVELADHVARVEIVRPPHNFFDVHLIEDIATTLERLDDDPACRATVLCSRGKSFCAGADFRGGPRPSLGLGGPLPLYVAGARLFAVRKPIIAAIQGATIGGGVGLALAADFRVGCAETRVSTNFVKLGTHPGFGITYTLPRVVGEQRAALMLYTGRRVTGQEALEWGFLDVLVPQEDVRSAAKRLAMEIAENAPLAVIETRQTLRAEYADAIRHQTDIEHAKQTRLFQTEDHKEGIKAVAERRPGQFQGR